MPTHPPSERDPTVVPREGFWKILEKEKSEHGVKAILDLGVCLPLVHRVFHVRATLGV